MSIKIQIRLTEISEIGGVIGGDGGANSIPKENF